jgi:hypothetical protein
MTTLTKTRKRWTDTAIETELRAQCDELGHFPTRAELSANGLRNLWDAMRRAGGVDSWRRRVESRAMADGAPSGIAAAVIGQGEISPQQIAVRAYEMYEHGDPGDALEHWLAAEYELTVRRL